MEFFKVGFFDSLVKDDFDIPDKNVKSTVTSQLEYDFEEVHQDIISYFKDRIEDSKESVMKRTALERNLVDYIAKNESEKEIRKKLIDKLAQSFTDVVISCRYHRK